MTSSFQSTAFQSAARPVDTFVAEPSVLPKTDAEELATVLQTVNPNLQKFIGTQLEKTVEEEMKHYLQLFVINNRESLVHIYVLYYNF